MDVLIFLLVMLLTVGILAYHRAGLTLFTAALTGLFVLGSLFSHVS